MPPVYKTQAVKRKGVAEMKFFLKFFYFIFSCHAKEALCYKFWKPGEYKTIQDEHKESIPDI